MGNASSGAEPFRLRVGREPLPVMASLAGQSLEDIARHLAAFSPESPGVYAVDRDRFHAILELDGQSHSEFAIFDSERVGRVDLLQVLAAMVLTSSASPAQRCRFLFQLFDLDGSGSLSESELVILLQSALIGLCRLTGGIEPPQAQLEEVSRDVFASADTVTDGKVTYSELAAWSRASPLARRVLGAHRMKKSDAADVRQQWKGSNRGSSRRMGHPAPAPAMGHEQAESTANRFIDQIERLESEEHAKDQAVDRETRAIESSMPAAPAVERGRGRGRGRGGGRGGGRGSGRGRGGRRGGRKAPAPAADSSGSKYSRAEILQVRDRFIEMDEDGSGQVSLEEFAQNLSHAAARSAIGMFDALDGDGSASVSLLELLNFLYPLATENERRLFAEWVAEAEAPAPVPEKPLTEAQLAELAEIFNVYDVDKDGSISRQEIAELLRANGAFSDDDLERLFRDADKDGSGELDLREFARLMDLS